MTKGMSKYIPRVAVVIPLYNKKELINTALETVLGQSFVDFHVYVVDDGSTDGSAEVVDSILDPRVHLIRQKNSGVSAARNRGVAEAESSIVAFLDADDYWDAGFLEEIVRLREKYPDAGLYCTGYRQVRPDGRFSSLSVEPAKGSSDALVNDYVGRSRFGNFVHSSSVAVDRAKFLEVGGFPLGERFGEDLYLWTRMGSRHPVAASSKILGNFRLDLGNSAPRHAQGITRHPMLELLAEIANDTHTKPALRLQARKALAAKIDQLIYYLFRSKDGTAIDEFLNRPEVKPFARYWRLAGGTPCRMSRIRIFLRWRSFMLTCRHYLACRGFLRTGLIQTGLTE